MSDIDDAHARLRCLAGDVVEIYSHAGIDAVEDDAGAGGAHGFDLDAVVIGWHEDDILGLCDFLAGPEQPVSYRVIDAGARQIEALGRGIIQTVEGKAW